MQLRQGASIGVYEGGLIGVQVGFDALGQPQYVVLEPFIDAHPDNQPDTVVL